MSVPIGMLSRVTTDTNNTRWVPFGADPDEAEQYAALHHGVPPWLKPSLWEWTKAAFTTTRQSTGIRAERIPIFNFPLLRLMERELQISVPGIGANEQSLNTGASALQNAFKSEQHTLKLVDYLLSKGKGSYPALDKILTEAGSAWKVGERYPGINGLMARVPEGVQQAADAAKAQGEAGKNLAKAWGSAFGMSPDPTSAYADAVRAVEHAAIPIVSPNDTGATLGKLIGQMTGGGRFAIPDLREHTDAKSHDVLIAMMRLLWTGQSDRHGGPSSVSVTQEQAEAAVMLAVTLVGWFETGKVVR